MKKQLYNIKGSRCDYSFHTQTEDYARRMYNIRLATDASAGIYVLENEIGNTRCVCTQPIPKKTDSGRPIKDADTLSGLPRYDFWTVVGSYYVQNKLYLFFANNGHLKGNSGVDYIVEVTFSSKDSYACKVLLRENLGLLPDHPLQIVSYYESEVLHKLYFIDGIHTLQVLNLISLELTTIKTLDKMTSINIYASQIKIQVDVQDNGMSTFKPSIRSYGVQFLNAYGQASNCLLDSVQYEIANFDGSANSSDSYIQKTITVTVIFPKSIINNFKYLRLYSFLKESYHGEWTVMSVLPTNQDIYLDINKNQLEENDENTYKVHIIDDPSASELTTINNLNIQPTSNIIISQTICTNGEYLLLGNNSYSSTANAYIYQNSELTKDDITISVKECGKKVPVGYVNNTITDANSFVKYTSIIRNNTKFYFKPGEVYTLGYQLYYDSGTVSDIIPLLVNKKNYTIQIHTWLNTNNDQNYYYEEDNINYVYRPTIQVQLTQQGVTKLKNIGVVGIKFYFAEKQKLTERRILSQCIYIPNVMRLVQQVCYTVSSRYLPVGINFPGLSYTNKKYVKELTLFPIQFFRAESSNVHFSKHTLQESSPVLREPNFSKQNAYTLAYSSGYTTKISDYPMLNIECFESNSNNKKYPIDICLSPFHVELLSPVFEYNTLKFLNSNVYKVQIVGIIDAPTTAVISHSQQTLKVFPQWSHNIEIGIPTQTGHITPNTAASYLLYNSYSAIWWGAYRQLGNINYEWSKFTKILLYNTPVDINTLNLQHVTDLKLFQLQRGQAVRHTFSNYPSYFSDIIDVQEIQKYVGPSFFSNQNISTCNFWFKPSEWNNWRDSYSPILEQAGRTLTFSVKSEARHSSIECYTPDRCACNISLTSNNNKILDIPSMLEVYTEDFKISYNYKWIPSSLNVESIDTNIKELNIGDTTFSNYICHINYADAADVTATVVSTFKVINAYENHLKNLNGADGKGYPLAEAGYTGVRGAATVNSYLSFPVETQYNCYYNESLTTLLKVDADIQPTLNMVFEDHTPIVQFSTWNSAEIKNNIYRNEIVALGPKTTNSLVDKWLDLSPNNIQNYYLNGEYGAINSLKSVGNTVYAFTDKAIFHVGFNQTSSIPSTSQYIQLARNPAFTGDYIISEVGCNDNEKVLQTTNGLYLLSNTHKELFSIQGDKVNGMGLMKFNKSAIENFHFDKWDPYNKKGSILRYNSHYQEVYIIDPCYDLDGEDNYIEFNERAVYNHIQVSGDFKYTDAYYPGYYHPKCLTYSEKLGEFTSYYDYWYSPYWFNIDDAQYSISELNRIYRMHVGTPNEFYDSKICSQVSITLVHNAEIDKNKILYSLTYSGGLYESQTKENQQIAQQYWENPSKVISRNNFQMSAIADIRVKNDFQDSGVIDVLPYSSKQNAYIPQYSKQKFQSWNVLIPRDALQTIGKNKYKLNRVQNSWNEVTIGLNWYDKNNTKTASVLKNKYAKIWNLTLNYN